LAIFRAAIEAANARQAVRSHVSVRGRHLIADGVRLTLSDFDRIFVIAAGKAACEMAEAIEEIAGDRLSDGLAVTKQGHGKQLRRIRVFEAAHPVPDERCAQASAAIRALLAGLNARDLLIVAISGGASALLTDPAPPVRLADKQLTTELLLGSGATIGELNTVRKHLSLLKGGRMAALAWPATLLTLLLSDVPGDRLDTIGSGPTAPDPTTFADALAVLERYRLSRRIPRRVLKFLEEGSRGLHRETPKPGDPVFKRVHYVLAGSNRLALQAALQRAKRLGYRTLLLASGIQGEAREVARVHAQIAHEVAASGNPVRPPACILSGGETTVTLLGSGKGGRNQEFALAAALAMAGVHGAVLLSAGTDGSDGPTDAAGAFACGSTMARAAMAGLDPYRSLAQNDSYSFFDALGDLVCTGPTGTNVMDVQILLVRAVRT
jgi:glycerate 2-kinase